MTTVQPNETRDSTGPVPSNMFADREVGVASVRLGEAG